MGVTAIRDGRRRRSAGFDQTRQQIIDKAAELFARNGYDSTGVADLGEATSLERGALYYYIGSKEQLLVDIHDEVMSVLLEESRLIYELPGDPLARLRLMSESLLKQIIERKDHLWVLLHEYRALQGEHRDRYRQQRACYTERVDHLLADAQKQKLVDLRSRRLAVLTFLGMHSSTYQWIRSEPPITPSDLSDFYCKMFFQGTAGPALDIALLDGQVAQLRETLAVTAKAKDVSSSGSAAGHVDGHKRRKG
jgi:TetR/AcrR family transcriptional regulator, cholesterol catabolism regulator